MGRKRTSRSWARIAAVTVSMVTVGSWARAGDFLDTRLTWTLGDDDILRATGEVRPWSPNASVGDRGTYRLFFDDLNTRFSGRENITHLALYKRMPGFIPSLETEAGLMLRVDLAELATNTTNLNVVLADAGTYLRLAYLTKRKDQARAGKNEGVDLTLFVLDSDRFRLGYLYDITWGGTNAAIDQSIFPRARGGVPGVKLQFFTDRLYLFGGLKTASILQVQEAGRGGVSDGGTVRVAETNYGVLGGGGIDFTDFFRIDFGAGYFQQGTFDLPDVLGKPVYTCGISGRAVVHQGMPVPESIDFLLYRNDPNAPLILFAPEKYDPHGPMTWAMSVEATQLVQHLKQFERAGATVLQPARAAAVQTQMKVGTVRISVTGLARDINFVMRNQPGFIPFQSLPERSHASPELFGAVAVDYHITPFRTTPGVAAGIKLPATFRSESGDVNNGIGRELVVREQGDLGILPEGTRAVPILHARASVRWAISELMSAVLWAQLIHDANATQVQLDPSDRTILLRTFARPDSFGLGTSVQARF